jgi:hypothetical protein
LYFIKPIKIIHFNFAKKTHFRVEDDANSFSNEASMVTNYVDEFGKLLPFPPIPF